MKTPILSWGQWGGHVARHSLVGGALYTVGLLGCWAAGETYSGLPDWVFRLTFIIMIIWGVWTYRLRLHGNSPFRKGLGMGMAISLGLALMISISTWLFRSQIEPGYNDHAKEVYAHGQRNKMVVTFLSDNDRQALTAEDKALIDSGMQKHLEKVNFFFTTQGAIAAVWIYSIIWGFGVSVTIAFLSRPVNKK